MIIVEKTFNIYILKILWRCFNKINIHSLIENNNIFILVIYFLFY